MESGKSIQQAYDLQEGEVRSCKHNERLAAYKYHEGRAMEARLQFQLSVATDLAVLRENELLAASEDLRIAEMLLDTMAKVIVADEATASERKE